VWLAACSVNSQEAPSLIGPSGFAQTVTLTASPDHLPRDGNSRSTVTVLVRNETGQAVSGLRLAVGANGGTLSANEVVTGSDGRATFTVTAPASGTIGGTTLDVFATPMGGNAETAVTRTLSIALGGTANTTAPSPAFTINSATPANNTPFGVLLQENVIFDASATTDEGQPCLDACTYTWDFGGEGTATGRVVSHRFQSIRTAAVRLTVSDWGGASASRTHNVSVTGGAAPTATFTFSPSAPVQLEQVFFTAEASRVGVAGRTIASYQWNFGDGTTASGVSVSHSYSVLGTFPVTLTVTDSAGLQSTTSQTVTVTGGLTAAFTFSPTNPVPGDTVTFNAESSRGSSGFGTRNPIERYIWHFGQGDNVVESSSPIATATFPAERTYTVTLTVVDSAGRRDTTSRSVSVAFPE
jgi:PKD repeat protein